MKSVKAYKTISSSTEVFTFCISVPQSDVLQHGRGEGPPHTVRGGPGYEGTQARESEALEEDRHLRQGLLRILPYHNPQPS